MSAGEIDATQTKPLAIIAKGFASDSLFRSKRRYFQRKSDRKPKPFLIRTRYSQEKARSPPPSFSHERYGRTALPTSAHCSKFIGRLCVSLHKVGSFRVLSYPQSNLEATIFLPEIWASLYTDSSYGRTPEKAVRVFIGGHGKHSGFALMKRTRPYRQRGKGRPDYGRLTAKSRSNATA